VPPEIRDVLHRAGFTMSTGKGSHRKWRHASGVTLTLSGRGGDDAKPYQEADVATALAKALS
jgi:predicted RNA binding protein YcfA (HicA-like mRNA interferase family)